MNLKTIVTPALTAALVMPIALPAASAQAATPVAQSAALMAEGNVDAIDELAKVNARIEALKNVQRTVESADYADQINDLLSVAFDLRWVLQTVIHGGVPPFDISTVLGRVELLVTIADTIHTSVNTLQNKVSEAHVRMGLETTKAVIVLLNPSSNSANISQAGADLRARLAQAQGMRDLQPGDRATIYTKAALDRVIWDTRFKRDREILGKADFRTYVELNRAITRAVGVWGDASKTVGEVQAAELELQLAYDQALSKVGAPAGS